MLKALNDIMGAKHCEYSNLQINKVSSAFHYSKHKLELILTKI